MTDGLQNIRTLHCTPWCLLNRPIKSEYILPSRLITSTPLFFQFIYMSLYMVLAGTPRTYYTEFHPHLFVLP